MTIQRNEMSCQSTSATHRLPHPSSPKIARAWCFCNGPSRVKYPEEPDRRPRQRKRLWKIHSRLQPDAASGGDCAGRLGQDEAKQAYRCRPDLPVHLVVSTLRVNVGFAPESCHTPVNWELLMLVVTRRCGPGCQRQLISFSATNRTVRIGPSRTSGRRHPMSR